mmetsp:Transcript_85261/g.241763  ORF Transcript_85261/g.241763 Transcript_85261/m.241763 type:complete len:462 (+) Transcript_85261:1866-3251(+)
MEVNDVGAHFVQEWGEVRGADDAAGKGLQPVLKPLDVVHIQVPSRLVKHEHIAVHELGRAKLHLHFPAARVARHWQVQVCRAVGAARVSEASLLHELLALLLRHLVLKLVDLVAGVHDPPPAGLVHTEDGETVVLHAHLFVLDLVLHEHALQLVALREALKLLVYDGTHERGLTALVRAQQTIEPVALEVHLRVAEQRQCAVGQGEGAFVEVHTVCVLLLELLLRLRCHLHLRANLLHHGGERTQADLGLPQARVELPHVGRRRRKPGDVQAEKVEFLAAGLVAESALENIQRVLGLDIFFLRCFAITGGLLKRLVGPLRHAAGLWVGDLLHGRLHQGIQPGHQRQYLGRILDQLAHVVYNEAAGALHLFGLIVQSAGQHRQCGRERRRLNVLDKNAPGELLNAAVRVGDGLGGLHHGGQEGLQIFVAGAVADGTHALHCRNLDLLLDVTSEVRDRAYQGH